MAIQRYKSLLTHNTEIIVDLPVITNMFIWFLVGISLNETDWGFCFISVC